MANSVYTVAPVRITINIVDTVFVALRTLISVTWNIDYQYNKINMADNRSGLCLLLGQSKALSACGPDCVKT